MSNPKRGSASLGLGDAAEHGLNSVGAPSLGLAAPKSAKNRKSTHLPGGVPWNSFASPSTEEAFLAREGLDGPSLIEWMTMTQEEFSALFKGSPIKRAKRRGLLCNVAVALGNWGSPETVPALAVALNDEEPLVGGHAGWARGRIDTEAARQALRGRLEVEADARVLSEIK